MQHKNTKYNIPLWNSNGFYKRINELQIVMNKYYSDIICLQEINFICYRENTLKGYTNYTKIRVNANRASGGISTFIKALYPS